LFPVVKRSYLVKVDPVPPLEDPWNPFNVCTNLSLYLICLNSLLTRNDTVVYNLYEIVLKNALDLNEIALANHCLSVLQEKFGDSSTRVKRLETLVLEATGDLEVLPEENEEETNEEDAYPLKRLVAQCKAKNDIPEAIKHLNEYLSIYMTDMEGYSELADLYLSICEYEKAAFCVEELIINDPNNPLFHCKYADIKYTMRDYKTARKYYAYCINLMLDAEEREDSLSSMRPVYGLLMACRSNQPDSNDERRLNNELLELAETLLVKNYSKIESESKRKLLQILDKSLNKQKS